MSDDPHSIWLIEGDPEQLCALTPSGWVFGDKVPEETRRYFEAEEEAALADFPDHGICHVCRAPSEHGHAPECEYAT